MFALGPEDLGPVQQSRVSCGAASLAVARLLADPLAPSVVPPGEFAGLEREIMARTNRLRGHRGRLHAPWPRALGTPPWGAGAELDDLTADELTSDEPRHERRYRTALLRFAGSRRRAAAYDDLDATVGPGRPALVYAGSARLPRHVGLVFRAGNRPGGDLLVYEPSGGSVAPFTRDRLEAGRADLGGWPQAWFLVMPAS